MLAPGMTITSGQIVTTAGAGQVPDFYNQGVGFMNDGSLALDTDTPDGTTYRNGIRQNADGAFYVTTDTDPSDVWIGGLRVSAIGQLVGEVGVATGYSNGNPVATGGGLAVSDAVGGPTDPEWASVTSLLHFDGADGATTIVDEKGIVYSVVGDTQLDTAQYKWGTASLKFDGTGDTAGSASDAGFDLGAGNFTIEGWVRPAAAGYMGILNLTTGAQGVGAFAVEICRGVTGTALSFEARDAASSYFVNVYGGTTVVDTWTHFACVRNGNVWRLYCNGVSVGTPITASQALLPTTYLGLGRRVGGNPFNGWIDDIRITKGVARYTANFTPPDAPFPNS